MTESPTAITFSGVARGSDEGALQVFRGIPYAAPPTGEARWNAARPHPAWDGIRDASTYGPTAPQPYLPGGNPIMGTHGEPPFDEDCLTLNVWTPGVDCARRPVLIWIHGGGFLTGSGNLPFYAGDTFASDGDLVVVSINYRLGPLGFLHGMGDVANVWLSDQVAALRWVVDNVAAFGGDPGRITLAGQSGGAFSIGALAGHPGSRGLFQRAILQSPPMGLDLPDGDAAVERTQALAERLGHHDLETLRDEPWERLVQGTLGVLGRYAEFGEWGLAYVPVIDDATMPRHPADVLADSDLDLIIGWTREEASFAFAMDPRATVATRDDVILWAAKRHGDRASQLYDAYAAARPGAGPQQVLIDVVTDDLFRRRSWGIVDARASRRPVRAYQFELGSVLADGAVGATHCLDLAFSFANFEHWGTAAFLQGVDAEVRERVSQAMHGAFIEFAGSDPQTGPMLPGWPTYDPQTREILVLGEQISLSSTIEQPWRSVDGED